MYVALELFTSNVGDALVGMASIELPASVDELGFSCLINSSRATVPIRFTRFAFVYLFGLLTLMLANGVG